MIIIGIALVLTILVSTMLRRLDDRSDSAVWDSYLDSSEGVTRALGRAARPLASTTAVRKSRESASFRFLNSHLKLGGAFASNMEVFLSIQLLTILTGSALLLIVLLQPMSWYFAIALGGVGTLLPFWPFNEVVTRSRKRADVIADELPDFAELLVMVLPSMSVPQALSFTTEHSEGAVADEMRELVRTLSSRTLNENEAFDLTASRLGTDDGRRFVDGLREAYLEGNRVVDSLTNQAEMMRKVSFQRQRAVSKKLPVKLTFVFALHFMPMLFVMAFLPVVHGLTAAL